MVCPPISGRMVGTRGPRVPLLIAGVAITVSCLGLMHGPAHHARSPGCSPAYVVFGLGFGLVNAPITNAAVSGMPRAQAGVAAAIASTSRQVGSTLGVAVVGRAARHRPRRGGLPPRHDLEPSRLVCRDRLRAHGARARPGGDDRVCAPDGRAHRARAQSGVS